MIALQAFAGASMAHSRDTSRMNQQQQGAGEGGVAWRAKGMRGRHFGAADMIPAVTRPVDSPTSRGGEDSGRTIAATRPGGIAFNRPEEPGPASSTAAERAFRTWISPRILPLLANMPDLVTTLCEDPSEKKAHLCSGRAGNPHSRESAAISI